MSCKRTALICAVLLCVFAVTPSVLFPQTSTSGVVTGTITDPSGASVPSATVTLEQRATGAKLTATVSNTGYYVFTSVAPGDYTLSIEAKGFRKSVFNNLTVEVAKSRTVDVKLELGTAAQIVEVIAGAGVELQTLDASVGNVMNQDALDKLPSLSRDATAFCCCSRCPPRGLIPQRATAPAARWPALVRTRTRSFWTAAMPLATRKAVAVMPTRRARVFRPKRVLQFLRRWRAYRSSASPRTTRTSSRVRRGVRWRW